MFQTQVVEKTKKHILCSVTVFPITVPFMRCGKIWYNQTAHRQQYDTAVALRMLDKLMLYTHSKYVILNTFPWQQWLT